MHAEVASDVGGAAKAAAARMACEMRNAIAARGRATLALSGGSSPIPMLDQLALEVLDWSAVHVFQVDERVVDSASEHRNWRTIAHHLVSVVGAVPHGFAVGPPPGSAAAEMLMASDQATIHRLVGEPPTFDVVHLGLGTDGHTASWPPGHAVLDEGRAPIARIANFNGYDRLTLTPCVVNRARCILWFVPGEQKRAVLERLQSGDQSIPAGHVARAQSVLFTDVAL